MVADLVPVVEVVPLEAEVVLVASPAEEDLAPEVVEPVVVGKFFPKWINLSKLRMTG